MSKRDVTPPLPSALGGETEMKGDTEEKGRDEEEEDVEDSNGPPRRATAPPHRPLPCRRASIGG